VLAGRDTGHGWGFPSCALAQRGDASRSGAFELQPRSRSRRSTSRILRGFKAGARLKIPGRAGGVGIGFADPDLLEGPVARNAAGAAGGNQGRSIQMRGPTPRLAAHRTPVSEMDGEVTQSLQRPITGDPPSPPGRSRFCRREPSKECQGGYTAQQNAAQWPQQWSMKHPQTQNSEGQRGSGSQSGPDPLAWLVSNRCHGQPNRHSQRQPAQFPGSITKRVGPMGFACAMSEAVCAAPARRRCSHRLASQAHLPMDPCR